MPDADKARAEKLAAAKKRVDAMKKAKAKKAGKTDEKPAAKTAEDDAAPAEASSANAEDEKDSAPTSPSKKEETPSLSQQSKMRSSSFRAGSIAVPPLSPGANPLSPDRETAPDIYRKHVARIEELERENKKLAREAAEADRRRKKAEEELEERDEGSDSDSDSDEEHEREIEKLNNEIAVLKRQNAQLQSRSRHGSSPSISLSTLPASELESQLKSKASQIESMELEISRLRAQLLKPPPTSENEQIAALEEKVTRAETTAAKAQSELADVRKSLERTAEKAVREGSERSSAETAAANSTREAAAAKKERDDAVLKAEALDRKVLAMVNLHKEQDGRMQALRKGKEALHQEVDELRGRVATLEKRLAKAGAEESGGLDDEGLDELEMEERNRLNKRIRDLEAENYDLRRGIWHDKRRDMQVGPDEAGGFTDVDLGGGGSVMRSPRGSRSGGGITSMFTSGISALTGQQQQNAAHDDDGLLDDDEMEFDEEAFKRAQVEESMRRLERVKEAKRALKNWEGWRLDLVEARRGGGQGIGEIFEA